MALLNNPMGALAAVNLYARPSLGELPGGSAKTQPNCTAECARGTGGTTCSYGMKCCAKCSPAGDPVAGCVHHGESCDRIFNPTTNFGLGEVVGPGGA